MLEVWRLPPSAKWAKPRTATWPGTFPWSSVRPESPVIGTFWVQRACRGATLLHVVSRSPKSWPVTLDETHPKKEQQLQLNITRPPAPTSPSCSPLTEARIRTFTQALVGRPRTVLPLTALGR